VGLVVALFPARVRDAFEKLALEEPDEVSPRPSFTPAIRADGVIFVAVSALGGTVSRVSMYVLGLAGGIAPLVPKWARQFSTTVSHENPETVEWKDGLVPVLRGFGMLYLLVASNEVENRRRKT
jgi:hypothetical protein